MIKRDKGDDHHVRELSDTLRSVYSEMILVSLAATLNTHKHTQLLMNQRVESRVEGDLRTGGFSLPGGISREANWAVGYLPAPNEPNPGKCSWKKQNTLVDVRRGHSRLDSGRCCHMV